MNYLKDHFLYQIFKISLNVFKRHRPVIDNSSIMINVNKIKLLESTESKTTKNENGENLFYLDITEVVLVHCNIVKHG